METAAIYARVSTDEQFKHGISIDAQVARCRQYTDMLGLASVEIACEGQSAKNTDRPLLQDIIRKIAKKQIHHLIVVKLDRLSRETEDAIRLAKSFARKGCKLHLISEGGPVDLNDPSAEMMFTMRAGFATYERKRIGLNTKFALNRKRQLGERISGKSPYGFKFDDGKIVEDHDESKIITKIISLNNEGYSIRKLIAKLSSQGFYNREGKPFTVPAIWKIINKKEMTWN